MRVPLPQRRPAARPTLLRKLLCALVLVLGVATPGVLASGAAADESPGSFNLLQPRINGLRVPLAWDRCKPVTWRVNVRAVRGHREKRAMKRQARVATHTLARLTGLDFDYTGTTRYVPQPADLGGGPAEVVIAFVRPSQTEFDLTGPTVGYGGPTGT